MNCFLLLFLTFLVSIFNTQIFKNNNPNDDDFVYVCDDDSIYICDDEFLSVRVDPSVSHPKSNSVKENVLIETSSSSHSPLCSPIFDAFIHDENTPCSSSSSSGELTSQLAQGGEDIHDEREKIKSSSILSIPHHHIYK